MILYQNINSQLCLLMAVTLTAIVSTILAYGGTMA